MLRSFKSVIDDKNRGLVWEKCGWILNDATFFMIIANAFCPI